MNWLSWRTNAAPAFAGVLGLPSEVALMHILPTLRGWLAEAMESKRDVVMLFGGVSVFTTIVAVLLWSQPPTLLHAKHIHCPCRIFASPN